MILLYTLEQGQANFIFGEPDLSKKNIPKGRKYYKKKGHVPCCYGHYEKKIFERKTIIELSFSYFIF